MKEASTPEVCSRWLPLRTWYNGPRSYYP